MIVVSNTSPLMNLVVVEHLSLLRQLYESVKVPDAVLQELSLIETYHHEINMVSTLPWIVSKSVTDRMLVDALLLQLDLGEAEAIALAVEKQAGLILIDEHRGRQIATSYGTPCHWCVGSTPGGQAKRFPHDSETGVG